MYEWYCPICNYLAGTPAEKRAHELVCKKETRLPILLGKYLGQTKSTGRIHALDVDGKPVCGRESQIIGFHDLRILLLVILGGWRLGANWVKGDVCPKCLRTLENTQPFPIQLPLLNSLHSIHEAVKTNDVKAFTRHLNNLDKTMQEIS